MSNNIAAWQALQKERKEAAAKKELFLLARQILTLVRKQNGGSGYKVTEYMTHIVLTHPKKEQIILSHQAASSLLQSKG